MKKAVKIIVFVIVFILLAFIGLCFNKIRTVASIKNVDGDMYYEDIKYDYKLDKLMAQGVSSVAELTKFFSENILYGYPVDVEEEPFGCSAFRVKTEDGDVIVGRNFDYYPSGSVQVHCRPKDGYESYGTTSLWALGIEGNELRNIADKISLLAAPYAVVDGVNNVGLSVNVLELETEPTIQDTDKTDLVTTAAVRILLDRCATVDEAISMLESYDMISSAGCPYHFLIADASGKCVVVEWPENIMNIIETDYVTNFQLSEGKDCGVGIGQKRYEILEDTLNKTNRIMSERDAMNLLDKVHVTFEDVESEGEWQTEWSVVYNLTDFTATVCNDMNYNH